MEWFRLGRPLVRAWGRGLPTAKIGPQRLGQSSFPLGFLVMGLGVLAHMSTGESAATIGQDDLAFANRVSFAIRPLLFAAVAQW